MNTTTIETETLLDFDQQIEKTTIQNLIDFSLAEFRKNLRSYIFFNLFFIILIVAEIVYFFVNLTFLVQSFVLAIHLALIFATLFSYFTFRLYLQTRKTEKEIDLKNTFKESCRIELEEGENQNTTLAQLCCKLAAEMHGMEYNIFKCPNWLSSLTSSMEKLSCYIHWQDVHFMKELLLRACVEEHIKFVRSEPTNLDAHAGLANAYVMLSGLYVDPRTIEGLDDDRWTPPNKYNENFRNHFRTTAERAIEEFRILSDYAPHDPWVHAQLAYSYRDLQMPQEEIKSYETILQLCPDDKETLYKLGKLYFEQGLNAKGLQVYETLKNANYIKAESLIHYYGAYQG
jgi:tetratricopeptide (TPR) repeat protein